MLGSDTFLASICHPLRTNAIHFSMNNILPATSNILFNPNLAPTMHTTQIRAPKSWKDPQTHAMAALSSEWYKTMFNMQSTIYHAGIEFFHRQMAYKAAVVPITTSSISSPMGLGSDSDPVHIEHDGLNTYLADSQQFALEYALRLASSGMNDGGVYYVGTSFRGEETDAMHLNQFCHFECELSGILDDGILVAERYVVSITRTLLDNHAEEILLSAGTTKHVESFLSKYGSKGFPQISMDEALSLPELTADMWRPVFPGNPSAGASLTRAGERMLMSKFGGVCWLTDMHHMAVPFYQAYSGKGGDRTHAKCADLLLGLGEIMGCGQRHRSAEQVLSALEQHEIPRKDYEWYIDMRRPEKFKGANEIDTVGWGIGIERYLCWIMGTEDVRDVQVFPRFKGVEYKP